MMNKKEPILNSQLSTPNTQLPTLSSLLSIPNSQLPTPNSQLLTPNSQHTVVFRFIGFIQSLLLLLLFILSTFSFAVAADAAPRDVRVIWSGSPSSNRVALTFDDGPSIENADRILNLLNDAGARATFFLIGRRIEGTGAEGKRIIKRIIDEGHEIGNHSYAHDNAARLTSSVLKRDIEKTQKIIESIVGIRPVLYRPPGGGIDFSVVRSLASSDIESVVMWTLDPMDWTKPGREKIQTYIANNVQPGAIILLHETSNDTLQALSVIIDLLQARGFELVTVSELLK